MSKRAIILDRDDTIIRNVPYLGDPEQVALLPTAQEALCLAREAGFLLVLASNQSGVGRGLITKSQVAAVNTEMESQLGMKMDGIYCCYAAPGDPYGSEERKPAPFLIQRAASELGFDPARSFMIGDRWSDIASGQRAGSLSILVETGTCDNEEKERMARAEADFIAPSLLEAIQWALDKDDE
ncbi:MAG: HAD-IIIA family hydrolase [Verrucomicrobiota bacterium]